MSDLPTICLTPGCPNGIGPEVLVESMLRQSSDPAANWQFSGSRQWLRGAAARVGASLSPEGVLSRGPDRSPALTCLFADDELPAIPELGTNGPDALLLQARAIEKAVALAKAQKIQGLVTGPIRKDALKYLPGNFVGHTEYLHAHLAKDESPPLMAFAGGPFLLGLATIHVPLKDVSEQLTRPKIRGALLRLHDLVQKLQRVDAPRLAVLGLNPHAGEAGLLGQEEQTVLKPLLEDLKLEGFTLEGPLSADGFFARFGKTGFEPEVDAVLAMYHDQGLAPYKILAGGRGVNITHGLSIARTSPDHGTAADIAGTQRADWGAMHAAVNTCLKLVDV